jgi:hypothetical protein
MDSHRISPSINVVRKKHTHNSKILDDIQSEYCLKRNNFDPAGPSPNIFINKLELRMKAYYNSFCKSRNSITK